VHEARVTASLDRVARKTNYSALRCELDDFNETHASVKRGAAIFPVKFGISFTASFMNQASALVHLYTDGTVSISHGGVEMGQGLNTKVAQIVASEIGVSMDRLRVECHSTQRTANTSPTAASTGADLNGSAALNAIRQIRARLQPVAVALLEEKFGNKVAVSRLVFRDNRVFDMRTPKHALDLAELLHHAWMKRVDLSAHGFYATPRLGFDWSRGKGSPFAYFVFGAALVITEVDLLTGVVALERVSIVHETARSLNEGVDRGQIEGAFMQGFGWCTMEELPRDEKGRLLAASADHL